MNIYLKVYNNANYKLKGKIKLLGTGYLSLNGIDIVNCCTKTIEKTISLDKTKNVVLIWKREKLDPMFIVTYILNFDDKTNNTLIIENSPEFDTVKVILNNNLITGKLTKNFKT